MKIVCDCGHEFEVAEGDIKSHRVLCGDATKIKDVEKVMNNEKAEICFTSPPYYDQRKYEKDINLSPKYLATFIKAAKLYVEYFCINLGLARNSGEIDEYWNIYIQAARAEGLKLLAWNIWDKSDYGFGSVGCATAMFPILHEWIFCFGVQTRKLNPTIPNLHAGLITAKSTDRQIDGTLKASPHRCREAREIGSVIRCKRAGGEENHPAMYPVELPLEYIKAFDGDVLDPFLGSGTSLIACEQLNRICYGMEISEQYVDVILERFYKLTDISPIREKDGKLWSNLKNED